MHLAQPLIALAPGFLERPPRAGGGYDVTDQASVPGAPRLIMRPFRQSAVHAFAREPINEATLPYEEHLAASWASEIRYDHIDVDIDDEPTRQDVIQGCLDVKDGNKRRGDRKKNKHSPRSVCPSAQFAPILRVHGFSIPLFLKIGAWSEGLRWVGSGHCVQIRSMYRAWLG
jgi:hypothetical protein